MMQHKALWELQEVEQVLDKISGEIKQKELVIKLKERQIKITEVQTIIEKEETAVATLEQNAKKLEQELAGLEAKKVYQEQKLYDGCCNNPKELENMKTILEQMKEQISQIEEEVLANMDRIEDKVQLLNQVTGQLAELKKVYAKGVKLYQKNKKEMEDAKNLAVEKQVALEEVLGESLLKKYKKIQQSFKNAGIARIEGELCSGCRVEIPIMHLKNIKEGNNIYTCENCGRILVTW